IPDIYLCKSMCEPCTWKHRHVYVVQSSHVLGKLGKKSLQEGEWKKEEGNGGEKNEVGRGKIGLSAENISEDAFNGVQLEYFFLDNQSHNSMIGWISLPPDLSQ
ncbi:hypothetical protein CUMW_287220, partial [Citrus unshiu]